jgi:hypothetical protein
MKASVISLLAVAGAVQAAHPSHYPHEPKASTTSTVYTTSVYTITECPATVTDCPEKGSVTTDIISLYTTVCPVTETETYPTPTPTPVYTEEYTVSTIYSTIEYTITACPPYVTNCPIGSKTTEVLTSTTICPSSTEVPYPPKKETTYPAGPAVSAPVVPYYPSKPAPILSTAYITTCIPTVITSVYTVTETPAKPTYPAKPYSTGSPSGNTYPPASNSTVYFTGGASAQKAGGLLMVVGLAAALL